MQEARKLSAMVSPSRQASLHCHSSPVIHHPLVSFTNLSRVFIQLLMSSLTQTGTVGPTEALIIYEYLNLPLALPSQQQRQQHPFYSNLATALACKAREIGKQQGTVGAQTINSNKKTPTNQDVKGNIKNKHDSTKRKSALCAGAQYRFLPALSLVHLSILQNI